MKYDQAEQVMARLATEYPERQVNMMLAPRQKDMDNVYHLEMPMNSNTIYADGMKMLTAIADDADVQVQVTSLGKPAVLGYLTVLFI